MASTYTPIATTALGSDTNSVSFASISGSYTDLVVVLTAQDKTAGTANSNIQFIFNDDATAANYGWTNLQGNGSSATSSRQTNYGACWGGYMSSVSGVFSVHTFNVMNYSNTTTYKTTLVRENNGTTSVGTTNVEAIVNLWKSTSAITKITINGATGFKSGSTFTLYGVKSA
jgi:hypothetical protein